MKCPRNGVNSKAQHRVRGLWPLQPALARFAALGQKPVQGANRAKIPPLVEELGKDLGGGLIGKARLVQHLKHGLALGGAEPPGAVFADGRRLGCLGLEVTVQRGPRHAQGSASMLQGDQRITGGHQRAHGKAPGWAAASSSCAFFCSSMSFSAIRSLRSSLDFSASSCSMRRSLGSLNGLRPGSLASNPASPSRCSCARHVASWELYSRSRRSSLASCPRSVQALASARRRRLSSAEKRRRSRRSYSGLPPLRWGSRGRQVWA